MKISWRKINEFEIRVLLDGYSIGKVELEPFSKSWYIKPNFNFSGIKQAVLYQKFESSYKAGKLLVKLYQSENARWDDHDDIDDTTPLDMRDMWKNLKP